MSGGDDKPQALPGPVEAAAASGAGGGDDEQPPAAAAEAPGAAAEGEAAAPAAADEDKGQGGDDDGGVTEAAAGEQGAAAAAIAAEPEAAEGEEQGQEKAEGKGEGEGQEGGDEGPESESDWELGAEGGGGEGKQGQEGAGEKEGEAAPAPLPLGALEEGHIFFFYRPKVQQLHPSSLDDVARFYIAMQPRHRRPPAGKDEMADTLAPSARADDAGEKIATAEGGNKADEKEEAGGSKETGSEGEGGSGGGGAEAAGGGLPCRLIVVGKKRLPDARRHDRFFGFVSAVAPTVADLTAGMGEEHYSTKTRGERTQPAARAAGRGTYSIFSRLHGKTRTHTELAYLLQLPTEPGEAQRELGIAPSARYVICIKNPNNKRPGAPSAGPEPAYTPAQRSAFAGGTAWVGAEEVSLLDVQGTELLLIGAREEALDDTTEAAAAHLLDTTAQEMAAVAAEAQSPGSKRSRGAAAGAKEGDTEEQGGDDAAGERDQAGGRAGGGGSGGGGGKKAKTAGAAGAESAAVAEVLTALLKGEVAADAGQGGEEGEGKGEGQKGERIPTAPAVTGEWA